MGLIARLVVNFLAALIAIYIVNLIFNNGTASTQINPVAIGIFSIVLMLLNALLKPILELLALPITCITFGLFSLVISGIIFLIAAYLVPGVGLPEPKLVSAIIGAVIMGLASGVLGSFAGNRR